MPRDPREELLWPPADMLDMNVAPEFGDGGEVEGGGDGALRAILQLLLLRPAQRCQRARAGRWMQEASRASAHCPAAAPASS